MEQYWIGDCRDVMKTLGDASINLVVTSPPYNISKDYNTYNDTGTIKDWEKMLDEVIKQVVRLLTPTGSFMLNLSPIPIGKNKEIFPLELVGYELAKKHGLYLRNSIIWTFNNMQNCTKRLSGRYENIMWFVKDLENYTFNLDAIRIPCISKNDARLDPNKGRNPTDIWYFDRVNNMTKQKLGITHPCVYPLPMIVRIIKMCTNEGDTVLDPFCGSGTTLIASHILHRNGIGIDIDTQYRNEFYQRLQLDGKLSEDVFNEMFEDDEKHQRFLQALSEI